MFDVVTIAAVADELVERLLDGRVQRVGLVDPRTLAAEVYAAGERHVLVASADDRAGRLHLAAAMPSLDADLVTPFGLLLRKYVRGGIVVGVDQPPLERLVRLSIAKRLPPHNGRRAARGEAEATGDGGLPGEEAPTESEGEDEAAASELVYVHLAVELMGRHSNLILVDDDGFIMESAKRVTPAMSRVRPILPRRPYTPPPPIEKRDPRRLTAAEATLLLDNEAAGTELAAALVRLLRGVSPQLAREIAYRVGGDAAVRVGALPAEAATDLARETRGLLEPLLTSAWAPRVYREALNPQPPLPTLGEGEPVNEGEVVAFAAVPMRHLAARYEEEAVGSISAAADLAFAGGEGRGPERHAQRRARLLAAIAAARERQRRRLASLEEQRAKAAEVETLRAWGELIYAYLWQIEPGQRELVVEGTRVPLDPTLSGKENAQTYFERYRKAQGAGEHLPHLDAEIATELAYLDQIATLTSQAASFADLEALAAEWEAHAGPAPGARKQPRRPPSRRPRALLDNQGNAVFVGRSGAQNDAILDLAGANDSWLHARGISGSHVVVRWHHPSGEEEPATIAAAAALAAYYSAGRESGSVEVDVTRCRYVRKIKGTGPGMVTYRNERTVAVRPADEAGMAGVLRGS